MRHFLTEDKLKEAQKYHALAQRARGEIVYHETALHAFEKEFAALVEAESVQLGIPSGGLLLDIGTGELKDSGGTK